MLKRFDNNHYRENAYILYDATGECAIIDPGMYSYAERNAVAQFINLNGLKPVLLLNTHCHVDHVLGNQFIFDTYGLRPQFHQLEQQVLDAMPEYAASLDFADYEPSPQPLLYLPEAGTVQFGDTVLELIFAPGHSPGHLCFYNRKDNILIGGDVLFKGLVGWSTLPGGDDALLVKNIREKLFTLPGDCIVYPGHGPETTIGYERENNAFLV